jgi:hypothetical protein
VSVTLSPPIRVFALTGVLAVVGLAVFLFLVTRPVDDGPSSAPAPPRTATETPTQATPTPAAPARTTPPAKASRPRAAALPRSGFPVPIHRALRRNRVVVVMVYMPGGAVDSVVSAEARAGAAMSNAGFVRVSGLSERLVAPLVAKTGVLPSPAVVVLKRPDVVAATLSVTDRQTIAQAVAQAR